MKGSSHSMFLQVRYQLCTLFKILCLDVKHMRVMGTFSRNIGKFYILPAPTALTSHNTVSSFASGHRRSSETLQAVHRDMLRSVRWEDRKTCIHPGVFVDLSSEEFASVCPLFANNLGSLSIGRISDQQRAAFSHAQIFGFMKAKTSIISDSPKSMSLVCALDA